jgi:hypothetical protein
LHDELDDLERYVDTLPYDETDIRFLLRSAVVLYSEAFTRLGDAQGFDPRAVTRRIAVHEFRQRWALRDDD